MGMRYSGTVRLENQSVLSGKKVIYEGNLNWPLVIRSTATSVAETFGFHPSDQYVALKYLMNHIFVNFPVYLRYIDLIRAF